MKGRSEAIVIDGKDNVAVALEALPLGKTRHDRGLRRGSRRSGCCRRYPKATSLHCRILRQVQPVIKYGQPIGYSRSPISPGRTRALT